MGLSLFTVPGSILFLHLEDSCAQNVKRFKLPLTFLYLGSLAGQLCAGGCPSSSEPWEGGHAALPLCRAENGGTAGQVP